jgi:hypothetical protein
MKKEILTDDIPPVDFSQGVRGKHSVRLRQGYAVEITQDDGAMIVQHVTPNTGSTFVGTKRIDS